MKIIRLPAIVLWLLMAAFCVISLPSCSSTGDGIDQAKVNALGQLAIGYAVSSGKISPQDAALIYQAGEIIFPKEPVPTVAAQLPAVTVDSGK